MGCQPRCVGMDFFVGVMIVLTSLFVPDTLLAIAAGVLFGLAAGTLLTVVGAILTGRSISSSPAACFGRG